MSKYIASKQSYNYEDKYFSGSVKSVKSYILKSMSPYSISIKHNCKDSYLFILKHIFIQIYSYSNMSF